MKKDVLTYFTAITLSFFLCLGTFTFTTMTFAQDTISAPCIEPGVPAGCVEVTNASTLQKLVEAFGVIKSPTAVGVGYFVSQVILFILLSPGFKEMFPALEKGRWKLAIVYGVSVPAFVLSLVYIGKLEFGAALAHGTTLSLVGHAINEIMKQALLERKNKTVV